MKQKKSVYYFLIIAIALTLVLPILNLSFTYKYKSINTKSFTKKQLFSTDNLETIRNYIVYITFNVSLNEEQVIAGEDNYLFLGNRYGNVIDKTQGNFSYTKEDISKWTDKLKNLQTWYEEKNIKFIMIIAPNKHSVYVDKLPDWIKINHLTITDAIVNASKQKNINILDLRPILIENKNIKPLYMQTDTHWNNVGAALGYEATIDYIYRTFSIKLKKPFYTFKDKYKHPGDLADFLKISKFLPDKYDNVYTYSFNKKLYVCNGEIKKKNGNLKKCKKVLDPVMFINHKAQYMINDKALNREKLLFICDSFAGSGEGKVTHAPLYNRTFQTIWKWHFMQLQGARLSSFVTEHKPDLVIYQITERDLYNSSIVSQLQGIVRNTGDQEIGEKIFNFKKNKYFKNDHFTILNDKIIVNKNDPIIILNNLKTTAEFVNVKIKLYSHKKTVFKIYYKNNLKDSYSESTSYRVLINKGKNDINLIIPGVYINNKLRIDIVKHKGKYTINDFSICKVL